MDELVGKQNACISLYRDQSETLDSLKDSYFTTQLPAMIKTMKDLDADLSTGINQFLDLFLSTWHSIFLDSSTKIKARDSSSTAFNFLSKIHDSQDVMSQYKDFYQSSVVEAASLDAKDANRKARFSLTK